MRIGNKRSSTLVFLFLSVIMFYLTSCDGPVPTREQIVTIYPDVEQGSSRPENPNVLCPFIRMLERAGLFDAEVAPLPTKTVSVKSLTNAAKEFGCASAECSAVAKVASSGQGAPGVDIERLHEAGSLSHDCGLTFGLGDTAVNDVVRQSTLNRLAELVDVNGNLVYNDIKTVKLEICKAQNVTITAAGDLETKLIFAYLGGVEKGTVLLSDVERLLNATMPTVKTTSWINSLLLSAVK